MPSADHPAGTVLHVTQIGFQLHDRVVRPCQVVVASAPPQSDGETESSENDDTPAPHEEPG